jgi:hypothetical protein
MSKRRISCLVLLLSALFLCWLLMGLSINLSLQTPLQKLESARKVWNQHAINDYKMTVAYGTMNNVGRYNFVVQDKVPISVVSWSPIRPEWTPAPMQNFESVVFRQDYGDYFPENLTDYTIDGLFDYATRKLADQPMTPLITWCGITERMHAQATFDEQYGYINSFSYSDAGRWNVGGGLLCYSCNTLECNSSVRILNFEPTS